MLILTRRVGESILIDNPIAGAEPIQVTVLGIKGNQVRIGIDAPADITILREEIADQIDRNDLLESQAN